MTAPELVAVGLVGGLGAVVRLLVDTGVSARLGQAVPWGTLAVNLSGAFLLGLLVGAAGPTCLLGTGFLGAYTTFSTWMLETDRLGRGGRRGLAAANLAVSLLLGLALAWLGRRLGTAL